MRGVKHLIKIASRSGISNCHPKDFSKFFSDIQLITQNKYFFLMEKYKKTPDNQDNKFSTSASDSEQSGEESAENPVVEEGKEQTQTIEESMMVVEKAEVQEDDTDPKNKFIFNTKYGYAKLINCRVSDKALRQISTLHYLNPRISSNYIRKLIKSEKKGLFIMDPNLNSKNAHQYFEMAKKNINKTYYGDKRRIKNPFKNCKTPLEVFNLSRRILIEQKSILNRFVFFLNNDGSARLKGSPTQSELLKNFLGDFSKGTKFQFYKHDFLIPYGFWQGVVSAENYEKSGIIINTLGGKKIYPLYGVWSPTSQKYLKLLDEYLEEKKNNLKQIKHALDLGCGTGVLGFVSMHKLGTKKVYALDKSNDAVRCSKMNADVLGVSENYFAEEFDLTSKEGLEPLINNKGFPKKYEMILCNPPWLAAEYINSENDLDKGTYDPKGSFLRASFSIASNHLTKESKISKNGTLLLLYSDLGANLGLQKSTVIKDLCDEFNLKITDERAVSLVDENEIEDKKIDPLFKYKSNSKLILYAISRF